MLDNCKPVLALYPGNAFSKQPPENEDDLEFPVN